MRIEPEKPHDAPAIEALLDETFGSKRRLRTVEQLRNGIDSIKALNYLVHREDEVRGSLRFWPISIGTKKVPALLLGPIVIAAQDRKKGYAQALLWHGIGVARGLGHKIILLSGDAHYYGRFGFNATLTENISMPGPITFDLLGLELVEGALRHVSGEIGRADGKPIPKTKTR